MIVFPPSTAEFAIDHGIAPMLAYGRVHLALPPLADLLSFALPVFFLLLGAAGVSMIILLYCFNVGAKNDGTR